MNAFDELEKLQICVLNKNNCFEDVLFISLDIVFNQAGFRR